MLRRDCEIFFFGTAMTILSPAAAGGNGSKGL